MSKSANIRKSMQLLVCRSVLSRYLESDALEKCLEELKVEMRTGINAKYFKKAEVVAPEESDDRIYYSTGGCYP